jgi:hypothetical protein
MQNHPMMTRAKTSNLHRAAARTLPPCAAVVSSADSRSIVPLHRENLAVLVRKFARPPARPPDFHKAPAPMHD